MRSGVDLMMMHPFIDVIIFIFVPSRIIIYLYLINIQFLYLIRILMNLQKITDKTLAIVGIVSFIVGVFFIMPWSIAIPSVILIIVAIGALLYLKGLWVQSHADQWLLVIRDGQLAKAGIGMKTLIGISDTVVKFPSRVEKVTFSANNVTQQMQGVSITGFAFWSVFREEDGPFRCYKYMQGNDANSNVRAMCESVVRSQIANSSLDQVLRNRHSIRDAVKKQLKDQFKGWGVWLETVQITEVLISSTKLFTDLQADFRQQTRLKAEQIELSSNEKITEARQISNMKISELSDSVRTRQEQTKNDQLLKRKQVEADFESKKSQLQMKRMEREKQVELERYKNDFLIQGESSKKEQTLSKLKQDFEIESSKKVFELNQMHDDKTLEKYEIDSVLRIYQRQQLRNIGINQYSSDDKESIASVLPALGFGFAQTRAQ